MNAQQIEVLDSIRVLARAIRDELGIYVACTEHLHDTATQVSVSLCTGHNGESYTFDSIQGGEGYGSSSEQTLAQARDELAAWLAQARKEKEEAA